MSGNCSDFSDVIERVFGQFYCNAEVFHSYLEIYQQCWCQDVYDLFIYSCRVTENNELRSTSNWLKHDTGGYCNGKNYNATCKINWVIVQECHQERHLCKCSTPSDFCAITHLVILPRSGWLLLEKATAQHLTLGAAFDTSAYKLCRNSSSLLVSCT